MLGLASGVTFWGLLDVAARLLDWAAPAGVSNEVERQWGALLTLGTMLYLAVAAFYTFVSSVQRARASERRAAAASLRAHEPGWRCSRRRSTPTSSSTA